MSERQENEVIHTEISVMVRNERYNNYYETNDRGKGCSYTRSTSLWEQKVQREYSGHGIVY